MSAQNWSRIQERKTYLGLKILLVLYRMLGAWAVNVLLYFIVSFYFVFRTAARRASHDYLMRLHRFMGARSPWKKPPTLLHSFQHFMSFARAVADKIIIWLDESLYKNFTAQGYETYQAAKDKNLGVMIITSHLGNSDISRAIGGGFKHIPLNILVHNAHAPNIHRIMSEVSGQVSTIEMIEVQDITPDIAMRLKAKILAGENVIISADRTPVHANGRWDMIPFLGMDAAFAQGPFILAGLMDCPVFLMFTIKEGNGYRIIFEQFADTLKTPRAERAVMLKTYMKKYVETLERYACTYPLQWYNFYPYWGKPEQEPPKE